MSPFRWLTVHVTAVREPFVLSRKDKARLFLLVVGLCAGRMQAGPLRSTNRRLWLTKSAATFNFRMWPLVHAAAHQPSAQLLSMVDRINPLGEVRIKSNAQERQMFLRTPTLTRNHDRSRRIWNHLSREVLDDAGARTNRIQQFWWVLQSLCESP